MRSMDALGRLNFLDSLRGIAIVLMIQQHFALVLMSISLADSLPYTVMILLGIFSAPIFLLLVGMNLPISLERRKETGQTEITAEEHIISRGIIIAGIGLLFLLFWQNDILHYIGLFVLATYPLLRFSPRTRVILGMVTTLLSQLQTYFSDYSEGLFFKWQLFQNSWDISQVIHRIFGSKFSATLPLFSLVIFGTVLGSLMIRFLQEGRIKTFQLNLLKLGSVLFPVGTLGIFWNIPFDECPALYVVLTMGATLLLLSGLIWLLEIKKTAAKVLNPLLIYGKLSLSIYIGHIVVWIGVCSAIGLVLQLSLYQVLLLLFSCYVSTWILGALWLKIKNKGPLELFVDRFT